VSSFSDSKASLLYLKTKELLSKHIWPLPILEEKETTYTQRVILPFISEWVKELNEGELHVRGDGGLNPLPIVWDEISLYPDVTIMIFQRRLLAIEVKFVRAEDPGGSLTKAIGQTSMYEKAGFANAIAIIFDSRRMMVSNQGFHLSQVIPISENSSALYYKPN
jgi:hypothetical protein